jgi:RNA polymerase sigma-70 factor (ECF subfamily)
MQQTPLAPASPARPLRADARAGSGTRADADALLLAVAAGDEQAVARLYDAYASLLYALALRIVRAPEDAEEVVLEAFTQAWRDAPRFDPARGSAVAWLVSIARSRALDRVRSSARVRRTADRAVASAPADETPAMSTWRDDPESSAERTDRYARIASAVRALAPPVREVVELAFAEGLTHSELAERLGIPLGTVKTRMRNGIRCLRESLAPYLSQWTA